jgi:ABC-type molybdate transport system ATPase subunit
MQFNNIINKPIHHRKIGLVFQDGRLFPNMSVEQNLRYGLTITPKDLPLKKLFPRLLGLVLGGE